MTGRYASILFVVRVFCFSLIFTFIQLFLEYRRTDQISIVSVISNFIAGIFLASVLGLMFVQLPFSRGIRVGIGWLALFIIQEFSNIVEGYFFTTYLPTTYLFLAASLVGLVVTFIETLVVMILFNPKEAVRSFRNDMRTYLRQRSWGSWMLRVAVGSVAYFPIYFAFGALISPFVLPYYQDSSMGLRIPSFTVMVPLEFARGFLYVIALFPILAALRTLRKHTYAGIVSLLYVAGAFVPFLSGPTLPVQLRMIHGFEILADCLAYAAVLVYLFSPEHTRV